jgi:hypothetical protein
MLDYNQMNTANPDGGGRQTVAVGNSILQIESCTILEGKAVYKAGTSFIVEVTVLQHDNPTDPLGSLRKLSFTGLDRADKAELEFGRIRNFLAAAYGIDAHAVNPFEGYTWGTLLQYVAEDQSEPLKDRVVKAMGYDKPTKSFDPVTQKPYVKRIFSFEPYTG